MTTRKRRAMPYESGPNLTPLVDVVLVVLIFLMLAGAMTSPRVLSGQTPAIRPAGLAQPLSLELRIQNDAASGQCIITSAGLRISGDSGQLLPALQARFAAYRAAGTNPSDVQLVIRPARDVTYQHVLSVYETAQRARFTKIALGATR
jgi:biopolymer transport protein ExbD